MNNKKNSFVAISKMKTTNKVTSYLKKKTKEKKSKIDNTKSEMAFSNKKRSRKKNLFPCKVIKWKSTAHIKKPFRSGLNCYFFF